MADKIRHECKECGSRYWDRSPKYDDEALVILWVWECCNCGREEKIITRSQLKAGGKSQLRAIDKIVELERSKHPAKITEIEHGCVLVSFKEYFIHSYIVGSRGCVRELS